jgi:hypothetical protein
MAPASMEDIKIMDLPDSRTPPTRPALRTLLALPAVLLAAACMENEETIDVAADGSVQVRVVARGDAKDMADGYPVPLHGPWRPDGGETARWLGTVGPDTGSDAAQKAIADGLWTDDPEFPKEAELAASAHFDRVEDIPSGYAPPNAPYPDSYLQRDASLTIERRGERTVYVFERTIRARRHPGSAHFEAVWKDMTEAVGENELTKGEDLEPSTVKRLAWVGARDMRNYADAFAREAAAAPYLTEGAALSLADRADVLAAVDKRLDAFGLEQRCEEALLRVREADADEPSPFEGLIDAYFDAIRQGLRDGLRTVGADDAVANTVSDRFERSLTAFDATGDLADENFSVRVSLPGVLVDGNFDRQEDAHAVWNFSGRDMRSADLVLRAVSVVE